MKILLIGNYPKDRQVSMDSFVRILSEGLSSLGHEVKVLRPEPFFCSLHGYPNRVTKWLGYIDKLLLFPHRFKKDIFWPDIVHICDHSNAIYAKYIKNKPLVITCHDLLAIRSALGEFRENHIKAPGRLLQSWILGGINAANFAVCDSKQTREDLLRLSRIREDNSSVVHPAINYAYRMMEKGEARRLLRPVLGEIDRPFLMHVGNNSWYKNKKGLLAIFRQAIAMAGGEYNLVLVGPGLTAEMRSLIRGYGLSGRVKSLSGITAEQLCALYSSATALIFPSLAEGFGWPVIEAQACGCPVFASNRAPMTEVGGAAAAYFDPDDPSGAASVITHALGDPAIIGNMRKTGLENAESFTISRMACAYMEAYKNILRSY